jgi:hypothetical protein
VEAGDLAQLGSGKKTGGLLGALGKDAGSCWSSFLAGPHFKVSCISVVVYAGIMMLMCVARLVKWACYSWCVVCVWGGGREGGAEVCLARWLRMLAAAVTPSYQQHHSRLLHWFCFVSLYCSRSACW